MTGTRSNLAMRISKTSLPSGPELTFCTSCGKEAGRTDRYCRNCGQMLPTVYTPPGPKSQETPSIYVSRRFKTVIAVGVVVGLLVFAGLGYGFFWVLNDRCVTQVAGFATGGVGSQTQPVDIYCNYDMPPVPTGISDYGVINKSGTWSAYRVDATQVMGDAWIYSISADNQRLGPTGNVTGLQLNVVLKVSTTHGNQSYWVQNIAFFDTNAKYVNFANQVWNITGPGAWMNPALVSGNGNVSGKPPVTAYSMNQNLPGAFYALPLHFEAVTHVARDASGVAVDFSYIGYPNAFPLVGRIWDTMHITTTGVLGAAFEVDGFHTSGPSYYNAEFVFTGPPGSSVIAYRSLSANISLRYVLTNGTSTSPLSVFEFGTAGESVANLQTDCVNGHFMVSVGHVDMHRDCLAGS